MRYFIWILLTIGLFACNNDDMLLTQGEKNAIQLSQAFANKNINTMFISWTEGGTYSQQEYTNPSFSIEGSFFHIGNSYFNLEKLVRFVEYDNRIDLKFE